MIKHYKKGTVVQLSDNFKSTEFDCHGVNCCSETVVDLELVDILQEIRNHFGKAVIINSGYRCNPHNKAVGGASKSKHKDGMAADIVVREIDPKEVAKFAESIGVRGIGLYEWGCHIDTRDKKSFWYSDSQEPRATFGGAPEVKITVLEWQQAALNDGFKLPKYGADGKWGSECEAAARKAVCRRSYWPWNNKSLTKLIQRVVGVTADGKFGAETKSAVTAWQSQNGLTADGAVGINSWKRMLGV